MHAAVVMFPGLNADAEMVRSLTLSGFRAARVDYRATELPDGTDLVAIPGGFSYGDYLRCGAIAKPSPVMAAIRKHAERGGFVLGICNGFQILTEAGLLPGALTRNAHLRFECRDVFVRTMTQGAFTPRAGDVWRLPIAHAEGRYQASPDVLAKLRGEGNIALAYATAEGEVTAAANPNGSLENIAGIYGGPKKNVFGLMPHPERMSEVVLGGVDGLVPFTSVFAAARAAKGIAA